MTVQYTITGSAWVAISTAGQSIRAWLDEDKDDFKGHVDVRIVSSNTGPPLADDTTIGKRISRPVGNTDIFEDTPSTGAHIFYAKCRNANDEASMSVEASGYDQPAASRVRVSSDQYFTVSNGDATTLAVAVPSVDADTFIYDITVTDPTNFSIGDLVLLSSPASAYAGEILAVVGSVITLNEPLNYSYQTGDTLVTSNSKDMTVDGSVSPVKFRAYRPSGLRFNKINTTRLMMECLTTDPVDLSKFGDTAGGLDKGLVLRRIFPTSLGNGIVNMWSAKTNSELKLLAFDWDPAAATNPNQGQNGFHWRYSFGGPDKHDNIETIIEDAELNFLVQDNFTGYLEFTCMYEGNFEL